MLQFQRDHLRQKEQPSAPIIVESLKIYPHRKAILIDHGGDMEKRWYIEYYQWHEDKEELVRKRVYKGFTEHKTYRQRRQYGLWLKRLYNNNIPFFALNNEINRDIIKIEDRPTVISIKDAISEVLNIKHPIDRNKKRI